MLTRRDLLQLTPAALLVYQIPGQSVLAEPATQPRAWRGQHVRRISRDETQNLVAAVRAFCGESRSSLVPNTGPLLFDQFDAVGFMMDEYKLPSGRLILNQFHGRAGIDALVVMDAQGARMLAGGF